MSAIKHYLLEQERELEGEIHPYDMMSIQEIMAEDAHLQNLAMREEMQPPGTWFDHFIARVKAIFKPVKRNVFIISGKEHLDVPF